MPAITAAAAVFQPVWEPSEAVDLIEINQCRFSVGASPFLHGLVEAYEREHHPVRPPDPVEALLYHMESRGLTRPDLGGLGE